ncbi:hypothetical protein BB560_000260 [Smittium megazygosporum]|uniref:RRM domain-containing protein n=1 Tax=Smittium megazygosporum TaxID=133381 RepID=A0A2T9ZKS2_9FUNG|nr:hypothetical protein BB560_000260 [Smittium megazygosporum]
MASKLPPDLLNLFTPRPPLPYIKPIDTDPDKYKGAQIGPISDYISLLHDTSLDDLPSTETVSQRKERIQKERKEKNDAYLKQQLEKWKPHENPNSTQDPYKTLLVSRLSYKATEKDILREFERYGPIKEIKIIQDLEGKPCGYAFVEFENEKHLKYAFHESDGAKVLGKRIVVDVERGRTVKGWKPRRLGMFNNFLFFYISLIFV